MGQNFSLQQPQPKVSVAVGETLTLRCTTSGLAAPGPVKWLKGWGNENKTIYDQRGTPLPRVTRAVPESNTDFTINITNVQPEDMGTYYCVKFVKSDTGVDEVSHHGSGTEVSMHGECSPVRHCSQGPHPIVPTLPTARSCSAPHPPLSLALPLSPQTQPCFLEWGLQL